MKKLLCLLLCLVMLLNIFAACSAKNSSNDSKDDDEKTEEKDDKDKDKDDEDKDDEDDSDDPDTSKKPATESIVPDEITFEGEEFNVLCREDSDFGSYTYEITADDGATDSVSQAVYERNHEVCDKFGLAGINAVTVPGNWDNRDSFTNYVRSAIDANLGEFDLILGYSIIMAEGELSQYFYDFNDIPYVKDNLNAEYYNQSFIEQMTVNGQLKYMLSDFSLSLYDNIFVTYFNQDMADVYGLESLYDLVNSGRWTVDKCIEMSMGKWIDENDDQWPDYEDSYGYVTDIISSDAWQYNFDCRMSIEDGAVDIDTAKMTSILEKMIDFKHSDDTYFYYSSSDDTENDGDTIFADGRALFYSSVIKKASLFNDSGVNYGILPSPMWDSNQSGYYTTLQDGFSVACFAVDVDNVEMCGAVFEELSRLSHDNIVPVYYDNLLNKTLNGNKNTANMLNIITDGIKYDFSSFYTNTLGSGYMLRLLVQNDNTGFASYFSSNKKAIERRASELLSYYK